MLKAGDADFVASVPYSDVAGLKAGKVHLAYADTFPTLALTMQTYNPDAPWAKLEVRQAIAHAIDNAAIIKGLFGGIPKRAALLEPGEVGYDPDLMPYSYDPALARQLLAKAGYPNGFTLPMNVTTAVYGQKESAEAVQLYLKAVGIDAKVKVVDSVADNAALIKDGKNPKGELTIMRATSISNAGDPANAILFSLDPKSPTSIYNPDAPQLAGLMASAVAEYDDDKRAVLVRQIGRILHDRVGLIPIWNGVTVSAMKPDLDYTPVQHQRPTMRFIDVTRAQ
jgi:peptide/nickel transport system substrate-binding protein